MTATLSPRPPLTERVLARLGPPRAVSILVWGALAAMSKEAAHGLGYPAPYEGLPYVLAAAYVNILSLYALRFIYQRLVEVGPAIGRLAGQGTKPFQLTGSIAGPLVLNLLATIVWQWHTF